MPHPLVSQLRFTRSEFQRALKGLTDEEAVRRFEPMNCISWNVGHLAWQEQRYWLHYGQGQMLLPEVNRLFANRAPACTPALDEVQQAWRTITEAADPWLDTLITADLQRAIPRATGPEVTFGSLLLRVIYHYWYHTGENMAIRQMLGHEKLPQFVGDLDGKAPYRAE
ncbi:MAG TPA: DinB family protein [Chloroflexia bacterium]|nr:DinB family protein [Chloroflexia bacterium]